MIESGFGYLALLVGLAAATVYAEKRSGWKLWEYLPAIVAIYFGVMLLSSFGLWSRNEEITNLYKTLKTHLLPSMIFLMLLGADLRKIAHLGRKMLLGFFLASFSIAAGFVGMYALLGGLFGPDGWKPFAALCGSWMGGTGNMVAIQGALGVGDSQMGYVLLIDSIDYALWFMLLLSLVPFAARFNRWSGAEETESTVAHSEDIGTQPGFESLFLLLALGLGVSALSGWGASLLPSGEFMTASTWTVIIATLLGIIGAMTPVSRLGGASELGNIHLYIIVALIASRADFGELTEAPLYIGAGALIIAIHAALMALFARIFRLDLYTLGIASLANIGGIASAPILASAYSRTLVPVAILMSMLGYIIGTFGGLMVGKVLAVLSQ